MSYPQIKYGTFTTTNGPAAVNVDLGFDPDEFVCYEADATAGEQVRLVYLATAGTGKGWTAKTILDNGTSTIYSEQYVASSHIATWTQTKSVTPSRWTASTAYVVGDVVHPVTYLGSNPAFSYFQAGTQFYYKCTTAGTSDSSTEPTWPVVLAGVSASDNGVYWTAIALGGTSTTVTPTVVSVQGVGVTVPSSLLKASTVYHYKACKGA
jgi:hypothetical protein